MLTVTIPKTMGYSNGMKLLDMLSTGYDLNYVTGLSDSLGEIGLRKVEPRNQLIDLQDKTQMDFYLPVHPKRTRIIMVH